MPLNLRHSGFVAAMVLAACSQPQPEKAPPPVASPPASKEGAPGLPAAQPPEPGTRGGLPDDRTPLSEAPFAEDSAQGAANVVQTYFALIGEKAYGRAWSLWSDGGRASGQGSAEAFAESFDRYDSYNAQVGAPTAPEGAAGSIYVSVPVVVYGRLKSGVEVHEKGRAVLRRVNDVPGSSAEQRRWHISRIEMQPTS